MSPQARILILSRMPPTNKNSSFRRLPPGQPSYPPPPKLLVFRDFDQGFVGNWGPYASGDGQNHPELQEVAVAMRFAIVAAEQAAWTHLEAEAARAAVDAALADLTAARLESARAQREAIAAEMVATEARAEAAASTDFDPTAEPYTPEEEDSQEKDAQEEDAQE